MVGYPSTDSTCTEARLYQYRAWIDSNIPQGTDYNTAIGIIHANIERLGFACPDVSNDYGFYENYMRNYYSARQQSVTEPVIVTPEMQEAAEKGIDPKIIIIAVIAFILFLRS